MGDLSLMSKMDMKFDFDDVLIEFAHTSDIDSRKGINPLVDGYYPIITAPMDTVVDSMTTRIFRCNGINVCSPRGVRSLPPSAAIYTKSSYYVSYSLQEFEEIYINNKSSNGCWNVLIDIANGHMKKLLDVVKVAKEKYGNSLNLMVGNVGTPEAYMRLSEAGADAIRVGVGNGNGCLTTKQTGGGYPMASLVYECYLYSCSLDNPAKIIADGGMKDYEDIIKALALGADYVMVGSILNKALDSAGPTYLWGIRINQHSDFAKWAFKNGLPLVKKFRGMSTKEVQKAWGAKVLKTSEGIVTKRPVEYTVEQWVQNFDHYLRSIMSYTNSNTIEKFRGNVRFNVITPNARKRFNK